MKKTGKNGTSSFLLVYVKYLVTLPGLLNFVLNRSSSISDEIRSPEGGVVYIFVTDPQSLL